MICQYHIAFFSYARLCSGRREVLDWLTIRVSALMRLTLSSEVSLLMLQASPLAHCEERCKETAADT